MLFVWPGNTQTDKVFTDASNWWAVAEDEGFITVTVCEQYSASPISVSHADSVAFLHQLRDVLVTDYPVDQTRFYSTGQSAGSMLSNGSPSRCLRCSLPLPAPPVSMPRLPTVGWSIEGTSYPATGQPIPNYLVYGYGDLGNLAGDLWDGTANLLDDWADYVLSTHGLTLGDVDGDADVHGYRDRFRTWTWSRDHTGHTVPLVQVTKNLFRSHNMIPEEMPLLWDFLRHFSSAPTSDGSLARYYSPSGFAAPGDAVRIT